MLQLRHEIPRCPICMDDLLSNLWVITCGHVFHTSCLLKSIEQKHTCPNCRKPVFASAIKPLSYTVSFKETIDWTNISPESLKNGPRVALGQQVDDLNDDNQTLMGENARLVAILKKYKVKIQKLRTTYEYSKLQQDMLEAELVKYKEMCQRKLDDVIKIDDEELMKILDACNNGDDVIRKLRQLPMNDQRRQFVAIYRVLTKRISDLEIEERERAASQSCQTELHNQISTLSAEIRTLRSDLDFYRNKYNAAKQGPPVIGAKRWDTITERDEEELPTKKTKLSFLGLANVTRKCNNQGDLANRPRYFS